MFVLLARMAGGAVGFLGLGCVGRMVFDKFGGDGGDASEDRTSAWVDVARRVPRKIRVEFREVDGRRRAAVVDAEKFSAEVVREVVRLEEARAELLKAADEALADSIQPVFGRMRERIPRFADWYYSYSTTYYFLSQVVASAASNAASLSRTAPIQECVARDIEKAIQDKYTSLVLRPDLAGPALQLAFQHALERAHRCYLAEVERTEQTLLSLVEEHAAHALALPGGTLQLDWSSQAAKSNHLKGAFERSPETSVGLVVGGTLVGKAAGTAAGSKVVASSLATKLASPFFSAAGLGGAAAGALAGPLGPFFGAGLGVGVDVLLNKGTELVQRSAFERDVGEAITASQDEWTATAAKAIHNAVDVWVDEAVQSLQFRSA